MKLAVLVTHPIQYFAPVFRALAGKQDLQLKVFYGCSHGAVSRRDPDFGVSFQWDCAPTEGYDHCFVTNDSIDSLSGLSGRKLGAIAARMIGDFSPDAVLIFSYSPTFISTATVRLSKAKYRLMLRAETTDVAKRRLWLKSRLRDAWLRRYYKQFSHFFPIGTNSRKHYRRLGVPEKSMTTALYAVDTDHVQAQIEHWKPKRGELRAEAGIGPDDHVLIFCGKMIPNKDPFLIVEALKILPDDIRKRLWLFAVGDGQLRDDFESKARAVLGRRAVFVGFQNQSKLGKYYALADTLVLPSKNAETWGLVVNEALQFGLQAIVSDRVGSGRDLLMNSDSGAIFAATDPTALAKAISDTYARAAHQAGCHRTETDTPNVDSLVAAILTQMARAA